MVCGKQKKSTYMCFMWLTAIQNSVTVSLCEHKRLQKLLQCYSGESFCNMVVAPGVLSVTEGGTL